MIEYGGADRVKAPVPFLQAQGIPVGFYGQQFRLPKWIQACLVISMEWLDLVEAGGM